MRDFNRKVNEKEFEKKNGGFEQRNKKNINQETCFVSEFHRDNMKKLEEPHEKNKI